MKDRGLRQERALAARLASGMLAGIGFATANPVVCDQNGGGAEHMRDMFVTGIIFGLLPFVFRRPWLGILLWSWLGYMNPHRLAWGLPTTSPFP